MLGKQIAARELKKYKHITMLFILQEGKRLNHMGMTPRQLDRLFISIYSQINHLEISIQNISLV